jgi:hypothetical protein
MLGFSSSRDIGFSSVWFLDRKAFGIGTTREALMNAVLSFRSPF